MCFLLKWENYLYDVATTVPGKPARRRGKAVAGCDNTQGSARLAHLKRGFKVVRDQSEKCCGLLFKTHTFSFFFFSFFIKKAA